MKQKSDYGFKKNKPSIVSMRKSDKAAILNLTANSFPDEVLHLTKDEPEAQKIFVSVENTYAKFIEDQVEKKLIEKGYAFQSQEQMIAFMETNCEILRDEELSNPLNVLKLNGEVLCTWYDFADVIGNVSKK
jgi:hypothetical protein